MYIFVCKHTKLSVKGTRMDKLGWTNEDIIAALKSEGWSMRQLSMANGYTANAVQTALHRPYPKMEKLISQAIGVSAHEIWPCRYDEDGKPSRKVGRPALSKEAQQWN